MARGTRTASHNAYRGALGRTQTRTVHVTGSRGNLVAVTVHVSVDAVNDPELAERLHSEDPARALNLLRVDGSEVLDVAVPVIYHDPAAELMVLVLGEAHRHRELDERIRVLEQLRADDAAVPTYAKDFAVVFGPAGLRAYLEQRAQQALAAVRTNDSTKEVERRRLEAEQANAQLDRALAELDRARGETTKLRDERDTARAETEHARGELERARATAAPAPAPAAEPLTAPVPKPRTSRAMSDFGDESGTRMDVSGELAAPGSAPAPQAPAPASRPAAKRAPTPAPAAAAPERQPELQTNSAAKPVARNGAGATNGTGNHAYARADSTMPVEFDDEPTGMSIIPAGADPLTTETADLTAQGGDAWLEFAATGAASTFGILDGVVRLALLADEQIARGLGGHLDVRVLLHRATTYPVVTLLIGPPAAFRAPSPSQLAVIALDISVDLDRAVLAALAQRFELIVDVVLHGQAIRKVRILAPLADNAAYILRAADDHLQSITAEGNFEPSFAEARELVVGSGYDLLGIGHAESAEFRDDKLAQLKTAQQLRRALAMARRFAKPHREDYLVCLRGFPLTRWHELRRHVLKSAVAWGLWMGPELAQVAVSEGFARSRRDLVLKLDNAFEQLRKDPVAFDLDAEAADDNEKALAEESRAHGVDTRARKANGTIKSEDLPVVSGSIEHTPTAGIPRTTSTDELLEMLDDKRRRTIAALELCDRADARAAGPVIAAVKKMSRAEAVRVLGKSVKFGPIAAGPLAEGLRSSKAYLRHGCALALALLRTEDGTQAVIEALLAEPTEIWREIARAVGQAGPNALMPLASKVGRQGNDVPAQVADRVAWAMAHIAVRGGRAALEQLAAGQSVMAPIAQQALALVSTAARDEVRVRPGSTSKDVTVNRAFSRRFFEALEDDRPDIAHAALAELDASGDAELLDDAELLVDDEDGPEAELDESDLIQP